MNILEQDIDTLSTSSTAPTIRAAHDTDIVAIARIVNSHARQGHLLPRSADSIRASLSHWLVADVDGQVVGCGSLLEMSPVLVEIRSLAVVPAYRSSGIGRKIVQSLVEQARQRGFGTVFALTRAVPFFERQGFHITERDDFPEKVWRDCAICPLQQHCDETAVVLHLQQRGISTY